MKSFVIENKSDSDLLWSNELGWTEGCFYDVFNEEQKKIFNLPIEGQWAELK